MEESHFKQISELPEKSNKTTDLNFKGTSPSGIFLNWEKRLLSTSSFEADSRRIPKEEELNALIKEFKADQDHLHALLIEKFETTTSSQDKQQLISVSQRLLIRLLDKLHLLNQSPNVSNSLYQVYSRLTQQLEQTLLFMEDLFSNYLNAEECVPITLKRKKRNDLKGLQDKAMPAFIEEGVANIEIIRSVFENVKSFLSDDGREIRYKDISYHEVLLNELSNLPAPPSNQQVREILYFLNYNHEAFLEHEITRLLELTAHAENKKHKIALLKWEQKLINQYRVKMHISYDDSMASLQDQLNRWINEEVKYLESDYTHLKVGSSISDYADKIQTSLSVAKLAVIIRLLVIDKIIINRSVAPMLRIVSKVFSTLQKDDVSFGSLEAKYHAPDKTTIAAVRDMLFKWINILGKLG